MDRPTTLQGYQEMFSKIYPHNTLRDAAMHLAEEIGEVDEYDKNVFIERSDVSVSSILSL